MGLVANAVRDLMEKRRLPVFVSYAHEDNESTDPSQRWLDRLLQMLKPLDLNKKVALWSDRDLKAGDPWREAINEGVSHFARVAVLLVSPAFLASEFIRTSELPTRLARQSRERESLVVIPTVLRYCLYCETRFLFPDPVLGPESLSLDVFQAANAPDRPLNFFSEYSGDIGHEREDSLGLLVRDPYCWGVGVGSTL